MGKDFTELIVAKLADETGGQAQRGQPGDGVGRRSTAQLAARAHVVIEGFGRGGVDQPHRALGHSVTLEESIIGVGDDVDNGIADRQHVERFFGHSAA